MPNKVSELDDIHPLDCLVVAQVRRECADLTWFYDHGYIRYNDGTKLMLREHQRVAMAAYGVPTGCHVHHIDRNRLNNRADNLVVLRATDHATLHARSPKSDRVVVICPACETPIETTSYRFEERGKKYCSDACRAFSNRVVTRPTSEQLSEFISTIRNWSELGRMFGVTDNTVRKWARSYGLL